MHDKFTQKCMQQFEKNKVHYMKRTIEKFILIEKF